MWLPALWWRRPSLEDESSFLATCQGFNYEEKYIGLTSEAPFSGDFLQQLKKEGFFVNHSSVKLGSGIHTFNKGKVTLQTWGHLQMDSIIVNPATSLNVGSKFGLHVHELVAWLINPLQIVYVTQNQDITEQKLSKANQSIAESSTGSSEFAFGCGTLNGHLLAGEERFSVKWNKEDDTVWYDILSFSKPAHFLSIVGLPIVRFQQFQFAKHSSDVMLREVKEVNP